MLFAYSKPPDVKIAKVGVKPNLEDANIIDRESTCIIEVFACFRLALVPPLMLVLAMALDESFIEHMILIGTVRQGINTLAKLRNIKDIMFYIFFFKEFDFRIGFAIRNFDFSNFTNFCQISKGVGADVWATRFIICKRAVNRQPGHRAKGL